MKTTIGICAIVIFCLVLLKVLGFIYFCLVSLMIHLGLAGWFALAKQVGTQESQQDKS
ncbi:hypothetical protein I6N95_14175 [Vagococcus sp. BWB3-3]|uniref:Uncharacterized protein n=1 Tax=Vagococcus allomyrinae TaxID=2794353 RepID=A0A940SXA2_9ENTE|nr:hypothetical protein [Vagococcus allomyrinae]MBP1042163.1 hypothetical protein [Vagococcus allomyrinae]